MKAIPAQTVIDESFKKRLDEIWTKGLSDTQTFKILR